MNTSLSKLTESLLAQGYNVKVIEAREITTITVSKGITQQKEKEGLESFVLVYSIIGGFLSEDYFDEAIIGITYNSQVVYDMDRMVELHSENNDCDNEEAIEYLSFNTWTAYVGDLTPVFVRGKLA